MTAAVWIENWLEERKEKTTRKRIWLREGSVLLQAHQGRIPSEQRPDGGTGWRAEGTHDTEKHSQENPG